MASFQKKKRKENKNLQDLNIRAIVVTEEAVSVITALTPGYTQNT